MAAEEITKFAINRTLGTDNFKPLDAMITNQLRMVASNDLYSTLKAYEIVEVSAGEEGTVVLPGIKMIRAGTARFMATLRRSSTRYIRGSFSIYKNNTPVYTWYKNWESGDAEESISTDISFNAYDILSFELYAKSADRAGSLSLTNLTMCGTIVHNIYEVIE